VNEALALAHEGYNEAARPIEAARFARIAELLLHTMSDKPLFDHKAQLRASRLGQYMTKQLKSGETLYNGD
jgi:hypothetical protein